MIKVETKVYVDDKEVLSEHETIPKDVFMRKIYKDVEIFMMISRVGYSIRRKYLELVKYIEKLKSKPKTKPKEKKTEKDDEVQNL